MRRNWAEKTRRCFFALVWWEKKQQRKQNIMIIVVLHTSFSCTKCNCAVWMVASTKTMPTDVMPPNSVFVSVYLVFSVALRAFSLWNEFMFKFFLTTCNRQTEEQNNQPNDLRFFFFHEKTLKYKQNGKTLELFQFVFTAHIRFESTVKLLPSFCLI